MSFISPRITGPETSYILDTRYQILLLLIGQKRVLGLQNPPFYEYEDALTF